MKKQLIPRYGQILLMFACTSLPLIIYGVVQLEKFESSSAIIEKILATNGFWTFFTVVISAPIAFLVWKFRDENTAHQLENQRKDVNLKEFQKIAEWVSGIHLVEDKIVEKTKEMDKPTGDNPTKQENSQASKTIRAFETEISHEFGQPGQSRHISSHSRQDGAVGLQVAAVYMLKPFYCGEHGDNFRKPALNLLTSAWLALFKQVEKDNKGQQVHQKLDPKLLKNSPLAIALTEVLLADGGIHLRRHPEIFPNLYLPYLNLHLPGLDEKKVLQLFADLDCSGINLENADLAGVDLNNGDMKDAKLNRANLFMANLNEARLSGAELNKAKMNGAILNKAKLIEAKLNGTELNEARLNRAQLNEAKLNRAELNEAKLRGAQLKWAELKSAKMKSAKMKSAQMNFAILHCAKLHDADLSGAQLISAELISANLSGSKLEGANLYLADLAYIIIDYNISCRGSLFDTENILKISPYLDTESLTWLIQAPNVANKSKYKKFRFERDEFTYTHKLPVSSSIKVLQALNPSWNISIADRFKWNIFSVRSQLSILWAFVSGLVRRINMRSSVS